MAPLGEGFDATFKVNERTFYYHVAWKPKIIQLSLADSRHGSVGRETKDSPWTNEVSEKTHGTLDGALDTNADSDAAQDQSASFENAENQTDSKSVPSDQKDAYTELVDWEELERFSDSLPNTTPYVAEKSTTYIFPEELDFCNEVVDRSIWDTFSSEPFLEKATATLQDQSGSLGQQFQPWRRTTKISAARCGQEKIQTIKSNIPRIPEEAASCETTDHQIRR